jgi:hypothetical protein
MDFVAGLPQNYELGEDATTIQAILRHADAKNNATPIHQEERSEREVEEGDEPARASVQEAAKARPPPFAFGYERGYVANAEISVNRSSAPCGERSSAGRASVCGTEGRGFKSHRSPQHTSEFESHLFGAHFSLA